MVKRIGDKWFSNLFMYVPNLTESDLTRRRSLELECSKLDIAEEQLLADESLTFGAFTDEADWADSTPICSRSQFE